MFFTVPIALCVELLAGFAQAPISREEAALRAGAFLDVARAGLGVPEPHAPRQWESFTRDNYGSTWFVRDPDTMECVGMDLTTGLISLADGPGGKDPADLFEGYQGVLTNAQLLEVCQRLWNASGRTDRIVLTDRIDLDDDHLIMADVSPTVNGVPFHHAFVPSLTVGWKSGKLADIEFDDIPKPPADMAAPFPAGQAETVALGYILANMGPEKLVVYKPAHLCMWNTYCCSDSLVDSFWSPEVASLDKRDETLLVYSVQAYRPSPADENDLDSAAWYEGVVDAKTGVLLAALSVSTIGIFGGSGHANTSKPVPFGWDLTPGPTSVLGAATLAVPKGDVSRVTPKNPPTKGMKLILKRCRVYVPVEFDAQSGLLWTGMGKVRSYGKPNAPLLKALKGRRVRRAAVPPRSEAAAYRHSMAAATSPSRTV